MKKMAKNIGMGLVFGLLCLGMSKRAEAATKTIGVGDFEKKLISGTTAQMKILPGKNASSDNSTWKNAQKVSPVAQTLKLTKKGWYSLRVKKTSGKYSFFRVKFTKKSYTFTSNTSLKLASRDYALTMKGQTSKYVDASDGCLNSGTNVYFGSNSGRASRVWTLEKVKGKYFRLKNKGTGLYLAVDENGNGEIQSLDSSSNNFIFRAICPKGKYVFLWNKGAKAYLHCQEENIDAQGRKNNSLWKFKFKKATAPSASAKATSTTTYPTSLSSGQAFSLKGKVKAVYAMKTLKAQILNSSGQVTQEKEVTPKKCTYNLKKVDAYIKFGSLSTGNYKYRVLVEDCSGATLTAFNKGFSVGETTSTSSTTSVSATAHKISYNQSVLDAIGYQENGNSYEKKACASFAMAYSFAIVNNLTTKTCKKASDFWLSSTDVTCSWGMYNGVSPYTGSWGTTYYTGAQQVLYKAYTELKSGRPCVLHVRNNTGSGTTNHWVMLMGYQNVTDSSNLSLSNFICIDPWDGQVFTVTDKYTFYTSGGSTEWRIAYCTI
ncbi:MAG: RICIN domain-containing protein [Eubacterium sp.]|nr:RICIN domain-containing protein [Eubacterium sp.]